MPTIDTLDAQLLLRQVREAGRLYEQSKACPGASAAAERRASELTRHASRSIQVAIECEDHAELQTCQTDSKTSVAPMPASRQADYDRAAAKASPSPKPSSTPSADFGSGPMSASIDYSRFDAVIAAELGSDSEEEEGSLDDSDTKITPRVLRQISHRLVGVIEDIKESEADQPSAKASKPPKPPSRAESCPPTTNVRPAPNSHSSPMRDAARLQAMYSADYSRFASIAQAAQEGNDSSDDGNERYEDRPLSRKTIQALEECEARLAALANAAEDDDAEECDLNRPSIVPVCANADEEAGIGYCGQLAANLDGMD